jgi:KDO2-lipid IV(A) lauroyltransferase
MQPVVGSVHRDSHNCNKPLGLERISKDNSQMLTEAGPRPPLTPKYWPGWLLVCFVWLLGRTPVRLGLMLTVPLGALMHKVMKSRRRIAQRNVQRCFPDASDSEHEAMVRGCFRSLARALFETAWTWTSSERRMRRMGHVEGLEQVEEVLSKGRGVLIVTAHISCLEIGARLLAMELEVAGIYRPLRSPVLEWYQNRSRLSYGAAMISKREIRSAIRLLRKGGAVWYAPDQDFGREQSVFTPFFGIPTATLLATHRMAKMTGCAVLPMFPVYDEKTRHYTVRILPVIESFPGTDISADLGRINQIMEAHIRTNPEQYWWIHRRFKTRPEGEPPFYQ